MQRRTGLLLPRLRHCRGLDWRWLHLRPRERWFRLRPGSGWNLRPCHLHSRHVRLRIRFAGALPFFGPLLNRLSRLGPKRLLLLRPCTRIPILLRTRLRTRRALLARLWPRLGLAMSRALGLGWLGWEPPRSVHRPNYRMMRTSCRGMILSSPVRNDRPAA